MRVDPLMASAPEGMIILQSALSKIGLYSLLARAIVNAPAALAASQTATV